MIDRFTVWVYNQNPLFWEAACLTAISLFITLAGGN